MISPLTHIPANAEITAPRYLGALADVAPTVIVDTREQAPLPIARWPVMRAALVTGDYSVAGVEHLLAIERKTVPDIYACCGRERDRFERELHRLRGYRWRALVITASQAELAAGHARSQVAPAVVLGSLAAWQVRYDVPVICCATPEAAAEYVASLAYWVAREIVRDAAVLGRQERRRGDGKTMSVCPRS